MSQRKKTVQDLRELADADKRYSADAYRFIFEALDYTVRNLSRNGHVTGRELLEGIREHAREQFGGLSLLVFEQWGIRKTDDFGEIVFRLVEEGLMGKAESDSLEDFRDVYDFRTTFRFDCAAQSRVASRGK